MSMTEEAVTGIDVKTAVQAAREFAKSLLGSVQGLRLEAVERTEDGKWWLVTLGFYRPFGKARRSKMDDLLVLEDLELERVYKVFKVDASSGEVLGMQMFRE
jgi:hypothetical protein